MAKRSEAMVQQKMGGRQNVVLLRTLKRTRLASASTLLTYLTIQPQRQLATYNKANVNSLIFVF